MSAHALPSPQRRPWTARLLSRRSEEELRDQAAQGDAGAFAELYQRHHQSLYRYCRSIVRHDEDARDALHNTWVKAWAALPTTDRRVPLRPWLYRIAHNEAIGVLRRRRGHDELGAATDVGATRLDEDVELRDRLAVLYADLARLPERQRSALLLRELCGLSHDEIGAVFSVSPAAAKQSIYEARRALHEAQAGRDMTCADVQRVLSDGDGRAGRGRRLRAHLRSCSDCSSFQAAIAGRPIDLAALVPPLPMAVAAGLLARCFGSTAETLGPTGAAATGILGAAGGGLATKLAVGAAVLAGAGVGAGTAQIVVPHARPAVSRPAAAPAPTVVPHRAPGAVLPPSSAAGPLRHTPAVRHRSPATPAARRAATPTPTPTPTPAQTSTRSPANAPHAMRPRSPAAASHVLKGRGVGHARSAAGGGHRGQGAAVARGNPHGSATRRGQLPPTTVHGKQQAAGHRPVAVPATASVPPAGVRAAEPGVAARSGGSATVDGRTSPRTTS